MGLSEHIRNNIKNMITQTKGTVRMSEEVEHIIVQICYEMYKNGLKDGHRMCIVALELAKKNIDL